MINPSLQDLNLSSKELKEIAKLLPRKRGIKGYKSMPEEKPVARIKKIRKEFNESWHKFFKSKINEIRRNLYEIEN